MGDGRQLRPAWFRHSLQYPGGGVCILGMCRARGPHFQSKISAPEHIIFTNDTKKIRSGASSFYIFCRSGDHHSRNFFTVKKFQPVHRCPQPAYCSQPEGKAFGQRSGVSGRPEWQTRPTVSSGDPMHFHARARSGAPHFSLCRGTYTYQNLGRVTPGAISFQLENIISYSVVIPLSRWR